MGFFNIHSVAKHQKIEEGKIFYFRKKISQCRKKPKGGTLWDFSTSICRKTAKKLKGDPLVSPGMACYAEKQEKPSWFNSLDQMVQFGAIKFYRTFKNYFGQSVWIEKKDNKSHYNSRVSLHEAPTKKSDIIGYHFSNRFVCKCFSLPLLLSQLTWLQRLLKSHEV